MKRENQCEGCRRPLRQFLASLLFRLLSSPSAPSPSAHRVAPQTKEREERAPCPALVGCHRHHLATTSPPIDQQPDGQHRGLSVILPASPLPRPILQVVMAWQRVSQGGRSLPAHPADPLHPSGVCLGIRLLSSSYHLRIRAIAGRRVLFFEAGSAFKIFFSAYQIITRKMRP